MKRIAVFARWPEVGRVKTRLAPALTAELACELHRAMLEDALAAALDSGADECALYWAEAPAAEGPDRRAIPRGEVRNADRLAPRRQQGKNLGERLIRAFDELLLAPGDRAIVIGSDCPALDAAGLAAAFAALDSHDLVLGPALDGGYYLIGLARRAAELFENVAWGTDRVLEQTTRGARAMGLEPFPLPPLADLDTPEDLLGWIRSAVTTDAMRASATAAALRAMGLLPADDSIAKAGAS